MTRVFTTPLPPKGWTFPRLCSTEQQFIANYTASANDEMSWNDKSWRPERARSANLTTEEMQKRLKSSRIKPQVQLCVTEAARLNDCTHKVSRIYIFLAFTGQEGLQRGLVFHSLTSVTSAPSHRIHTLNVQRITAGCAVQTAHGGEGQVAPEPLLTGKPGQVSQRAGVTRRRRHLRSF